MRVAPVVVVVVLLGAAGAQQTEVFERALWPVGAPYANNRQLHLGDVDADGRLDLLDINADGIDVARGLGGFAFGATVHTFLGESPLHLALGHVDGDALLDAAVLVGPSSWQPVIQIGDGSGAFAPAGSVAVPDFTRDLLLADVTGDGFDDLLVLTGEPGVPQQLLVCSSDGSGGLLTPVATSTSSNGRRLLLGDVVEDGIADVVVTYALSSCSFGTGTYATLQGDGAGHFSLASSVCLASGVVGDDIADLDGDGHLDLLAHDVSAVRAFLGAGDGSFTAEIVAGSGTVRPVPADVTGDGLVDVMGILSKAGSLTLPALGGGAFGPRRDSAFMPAGLFADLDGDGLADAVAANLGGPGTVVAPNRGDGTWDSALTSKPLAGPSLEDTALGDFDGDGCRDIAQAHAAFPELGVWVMQGRGDGTFEHGAFTSAGASAVQAVRVGDATNDGNEDVLAVLFNGQARLLVGHGDGSFDPGLALNGPFTSASDGLIADLNGDGRAEIIECVQPSAVAVFLAKPTGGWNPAVSYPALGSSVELALADLDQDGLLDVVASGNVCFNIGHGLLGPAQQPLPGKTLTAVECADFDEDGLQDVAAVLSAPQPDQALVLLFGLGGGGFGPPKFEPLTTYQADLAVADMNRDGHADLVTSSVGRELALRLGDGAGNFVLDRFLASPGTGGGATPTFDIGDVNGDDWPDIVSTESGGVATLINQLGAWHDLGYAFDKSDGVAAQLSGGGALQAGTPVVLHVGAAGAGADVALVVGVARDMLPFKGGVMVPSLDLLLAGLTADAQGHVVLEATWPVALPTGTELFVQAFVEDAGAPAGLAPSNALSARAP